VLQINKFETVISAIFLLFLTINQNSYASYVNYNSSDSSYSNSFESIPYTNSGFYYSDPRGNSMSITETRSYPVIVNQYPNANWVWINNNGNIPGNALVLQYINGNPVFYCRVQNGNALYYGRLVPNQGCYLTNNPNQAFNTYQVLIR
jgi:hypothetical protein